jgi:WD40 repeat protein
MKMFRVNYQTNQARLRIGLILPLAGLIGSAILVLGTAKVTTAQPVYPSWSYTGNLNEARRFHTATLLPNGKVLIVGGINNNCTSGGCARLSSAELYDPATGTWSITGSLNKARDFHTATLLPNGKVLVAGGEYFGFSNSFGSAELYDPATGTWSITGNLNTPRAFHTATLLPNGRVLIVGGDNFGALSSAELYDPLTGTWSITGNLNASRGDAHTATLLPNGKILVAGGGLNSAELYDPATGTWSITGSTAHSYYRPATLLPNGKVLVGWGDNELYDPATGMWSFTGNLNYARAHHTATLLPNGTLLVTGGVGHGAFGSTISSAELYDPANGTWSPTAYLNMFRWSHTATLLPNGKVLVAGGEGVGYENTNTAELYDPSSSPNINILDDSRFFAHQHYIDFLNREPDASGVAFWTNEITSCGGNAQCVEIKRISVSASFFLSIEFQETGFFVYRVNKAAHGNLPGIPVPIRLDESISQTSEVGQGVIVRQSGWEQILESNKQSFLFDADDGDRFTINYPTSMTPSEFVDTLFANAEITPTAAERAVAINEFGTATKTFDVPARARVLRRVAESPTLTRQEFNRAFVLMQYFGYLRRNPNDPPESGLNFDGYNFWLAKLNQFNGNFIQAEMVKAFISSSEYRQRFGQP